MLNSYEKTGDFTYKCKKCGEEVEAGMRNFVNHAEKCYTGIHTLPATDKDKQELIRRAISEEVDKMNFPEIVFHTKQAYEAFQKAVQEHLKEKSGPFPEVPKELHATKVGEHKIRIKDELDWLKDFYTPEQIREMWEAAKPYIDTKDSGKLRITGTPGNNTVDKYLGIDPTEYTNAVKVEDMSVGDKVWVFDLSSYRSSPELPKMGTVAYVCPNHAFISVKFPGDHREWEAYNGCFGFKIEEK